MFLFLARDGTMIQQQNLIIVLCLLVSCECPERLAVLASWSLIYIAFALASERGTMWYGRANAYINRNIPYTNRSGASTVHVRRYLYCTVRYANVNRSSCSICIRSARSAAGRVSRSRGAVPPEELVLSESGHAVYFPLFIVSICAL